MLNTERLCPGCMNDSGDEMVCPICKWDSSSKNDAEALPIRFWLSDRYMIGKVVLTNGEGITYLGWDNEENTAVNVKEYFPSGVAARNPDKTVSICEGKEFAFNEGLLNFIELNKKLNENPLPVLTKIRQVFEENGTAYAVSDTVSGITLKAFLERNNGSLKWEQARPLFLPLIDTVMGLNELGIIHGAISPETIYVCRDGKLRLTGVCINETRASKGELSASVYSGYAAPEQYGISDIDMGGYTDVYGLSATLFRVLIGTVPPDAKDRLNGDNLSIPAKFADELPRQVLVSVANGLQLDLSNRTDSVDTFRNELVYGETKENERRAAAKKAAEAKAAKEGKTPPKKKGSAVKYAIISALCTIVILGGVFAVLSKTIFKDGFMGDDEEPIISNPDSVVMPDTPSIGDVDEGADKPDILYKVPDLKGKYYSQIIDEEEYERFKFIVEDKEYSNKYDRGTICAQSVEAGTEVEKDTEIAVTISLGTLEVSVANVVGQTEDSAKLELLKQGFLYENIEVVDKYDTEKKPGIVLGQEPEFGSTANTEQIIRIYVNSYKGEDTDSSNSGDSSNANDDSDSGDSQQE